VRGSDGCFIEAVTSRRFWSCLGNVALSVDLEHQDHPHAGLDAVFQRLLWILGARIHEHARRTHADLCRRILGGVCLGSRAGAYEELPEAERARDQQREDRTMHAGTSDIPNGARWEEPYAEKACLPAY
jgi:hypothetical protein